MLAHAQCTRWTKCQVVGKWAFEWDSRILCTGKSIFTLTIHMHTNTHTPQPNHWMIGTEQNVCVCVIHWHKRGRTHRWEQTRRPISFSTIVKRAQTTYTRVRRATKQEKNRNKNQSDTWEKRARIEKKNTQRKMKDSWVNEKEWELNGTKCTHTHKHIRSVTNTYSQHDWVCEGARQRRVLSHFFIVHICVRGKLRTNFTFTRVRELKTKTDIARLMCYARVIIVLWIEKKWSKEDE